MFSRLGKGLKQIGRRKRTNSKEDDPPPSTDDKPAAREQPGIGTEAPVSAGASCEQTDGTSSGGDVSAGQNADRPSAPDPSFLKNLAPATIKSPVEKPPLSADPGPKMSTSSDKEKASSSSSSSSSSPRDAKESSAKSKSSSTSASESVGEDDSDEFHTMTVRLDPKLHEKFGHLAAGSVATVVADSSSEGEAPVGSKFRDSTMAEDPEKLYELQEEMGEGSYGAVYKARDKRSGKVCAIKIVPTDAEDTEELRKEIDYLKKATHPFVVGYHGSFQKEGKIWIVMDVCEAGSISDLIRATQSTLREDEIQAVAACMLLGLQHLHGKRMVHRDIKAGNILLTADGFAKLADFGVSKELTTVQSKCDTTIGTPYWMGPEVIQEGKYDTKADIWSLGITLIELADGAPPFSNIHPMRALFVIPKKPPSTFYEPNLWSKELNDFLSLCLVKDPTQRKSAAELLKHPFVEETASELAKAIAPGASEQLAESCAVIQTIRALVEECLPMIQARRLERQLEIAAEASRGSSSTSGDRDATVAATLPKQDGAQPPRAPNGTWVEMDATVKMDTQKLQGYSKKQDSEEEPDFMKFFAGTSHKDAESTIRLAREEFSTLKLGKTRPPLSGTMVESADNNGTQASTGQKDFMRYFDKTRPSDKSGLL